MRTTIDAAGRLVVPKALRDQLGFAPGCELKLEAADGRLEVSVPSRVRVEDAESGARFVADDAPPLTAEAVRELMERGRALTADTSVVVAALSAWHESRRPARAVREVEAVPAHALLEAYSVLTRLPGGLAVPADSAVAVLARRFPRAPLRLTARACAALPATLAHAGVFAGSSYDGLVALEAHAHGHELLTLDRRAQRTYRQLGVPFRSL